MPENTDPTPEPKPKAKPPAEKATEVSDAEAAEIAAELAAAREAEQASLAAERADLEEQRAALAAERADVELLAQQAKRQVDLAEETASVAAKTSTAVMDRPHPQVPVGSVPVPHQTHETWRNATKGRVVIVLLDAAGQKRHDIIGSLRTFQITPAERMMNQHIAASEKQDAFLNGTLQPVALIPGLPAHEQARATPNHVKDGEMEDLFSVDYGTFEVRIGEIENETALRSLLTMANDPATDAKVRQVKIIQDRLDIVGEKPITHVKPGMVDDGNEPTVGAAAGMGKAVTPK